MLGVLNSAGVAICLTPCGSAFASGTRARPLQSPERGLMLSVSLSLKEDIIRCTGIVATIHPQVGNGSDFIDMAPDDRLKLNEYIKEYAVEPSNESGD
jgi:hypothetical protein